MVMDSYIMTAYKELADSRRTIMALNKEIANLEKEIANKRELIAIQELRTAYINESIYNHMAKGDLMALRNNQPVSFTPVTMPGAQPVVPQVPIQQQRNFVPVSTPVAAGAPVAPVVPVGVQGYPVQSPNPQNVAQVVTQQPVQDNKSYLSAEERRRFDEVLRNLYMANRTSDVQKIFESYNIASINEATPDMAPMIFRDLSNLAHASAQTPMAY